MSNGRLPPAPVQIAPMTAEDIPQVAAIDRASFPNPWSPNSYRHELLENENAHLLVAVLEPASPPEPGPAAARPWWKRWRRGPAPPPRTVIGFVGYWYVVDEAHISTIAVRSDWRGRGVGERLLAAALEQARSLGAILATLEVRAGNVAAQNLYRKFGFDEVGRRPHYYRDNGETAILMTVKPI